MRNINNQMLSVVSRFCNDFSGQVEGLISLIPEDMSTAPEHFTNLHKLHAETHRLCGASHCMGFLQVGRELEKIDREVMSLNGASPDRVRQTLPIIRRKLEAVNREFGWLSPARSKLINRASALEELEAAEKDGELERASENAKMRILGREKVLFADDDPYVRELMEQTLTELGVNDIAVASSGREVLDMLETFEPTVLVTDWNMEPVSGLELLKRIRQGRTSLERDTPVMFFTAVKDRKGIMEANRYGLNQLLSKPLLPSELSEAVLKVVGKRFQTRNKVWDVG
ncbi:response regulator [Ponticaulis sp.]|uniref:response regulator n=1 Tax=Ponticaulis sp. TaxID=2020902 RepID=UPI0025D885F7|nr:response regulator [Ponticaulis sp.]